MHSKLQFLLAAALLLTPLAAEARNTKGPWSMLVNAAGEKVHGDEEIFVGRLIGQPTGKYEVFVVPKRDVRPIGDCVAVASPAQGAVGTIGIEASGGNAYTFVVWTTTGAGAALTDLPFYIVVHCPKLKKGG